MRLKISISSSKYSKGDRVIVKREDGWYVSTVTTVRGNKLYVVFDDGDKGSYPVNSKVKILGLAKKRTKRKSVINESDLKNWTDNLPKRKVQRKSGSTVRKERKQFTVDLDKEHPAKTAITYNIIDDDTITVPDKDLGTIFRYGRRK